jgi:hypothetical protein
MESSDWHDAPINVSLPPAFGRQRRWRGSLPVGANPCVSMHDSQEAMSGCGLAMATNTACLSAGWHCRSSTPTSGQIALSANLLVDFHLLTTQ